jgi:hypothetical protein
MNRLSLRIKTNTKAYKIKSFPKLTLSVDYQSQFDSDLMLMTNVRKHVRLSHQWLP